jgi:hypothetical protein
MSSRLVSGRRPVVEIVEDGRVRELEIAKQVVIYRRGHNFGFHLPEQHFVKLSVEKRYVYLGIPDRGGFYDLDRIEDTDEIADEFRIHVGAMREPGVGQPPEYPFPEFRTEMLRLSTLWRDAGLRETDFHAWAQGASWDSHTYSIRKQLRAAGP